MPVKKPRLIAAGALFVLLSLSAVAVLLLLDGAVPRVPVEAPGGAADLIGFDFAPQVAHITDAEFYAGSILAPSEIGQPGRASGGYDRTARYHTARVRFFVPDGDYVIFGLSPQYASRMYVNGVHAGAVGRFDENDEGSNIYQVAQFSIIARPVDGEIELVIQMAGIIHDVTSYSGVFIGSPDTAAYRRLCDMAYRLIPVAIAFTCMLFFLGYFIFMPSVKANLWFALISLFTGFFLSGSDGVVTALLPGAGVGYVFEFYAANITLLAMSALYLLFIRSFYGIPKAVPAAVCLISVLLASMLFLPISTVSRFSMIHVAFIFSVNIACIACILAKAKTFKAEHVISLCGQAAFMLGGVFDLLGAVGVMRHYDLTPMGILVFIFAQMLALYIVNNRAAENERRLAAENESLENMNRMKTELLTNMSHELKTPLTVISNMAQLAARRTSDDYVRVKMETAVTEVSRMKAKIVRLLELAKMDDAGKQWDFQAVDLRELIYETVPSYFQALDEHSNSLSIELPENLPGVRADLTHLPGVIVNLIENAVRFTKNGRITVSAAYDEANVTVSVEDTGGGIEPEQTRLIFERFYTGSGSTGTGLGLHICKKVVEAHGGEISVRSEPGTGTTVSFTLPVMAL